MPPLPDRAAANRDTPAPPAESQRRFPPPPPGGDTVPGAPLPRTALGPPPTGPHTARRSASGAPRSPAADSRGPADTPDSPAPPGRRSPIGPALAAAAAAATRSLPDR